MVTEHVWVRILEGQEAAFEHAISGALSLITSAPNCFGIAVRRQVEDPSTYVYLIEWASVADHMAFRETDLFTQWRALTTPFYAEPATVTHFESPLAQA